MAIFYLAMSTVKIAQVNNTEVIIVLTLLQKKKSCLARAWTSVSRDKYGVMALLKFTVVS